MMNIKKCGTRPLVVNIVKQKVIWLIVNDYLTITTAAKWQLVTSAGTSIHQHVPL